MISSVLQLIIHGRGGNSSLLKELSFLKRRLAAGCDNKTEVRQLETLLIQLFDQQLQGLKIRSQVKWIEEGETFKILFSIRERAAREGFCFICF